MGLLLAVKDREDLEAVLSALPQTLPFLCFIITYLALQIGRISFEIDSSVVHIKIGVIL
jgi:hypothetical protein